MRYNPFEETGGNQSFALALLDAEGDGWVLSASTRAPGRASTPRRSRPAASETGLSEEEPAAIRQATA